MFTINYQKFKELNYFANTANQKKFRWIWRSPYWNPTILYVQIWLCTYFCLTRDRFAGLSMNIWHTGNKSSVQRGFFTYRVGDLLPPPPLGPLGGLHNFNVSQWYVEGATCFTDFEMIKYYQKTYGWNSLQKQKTT